MNDHLMNSTEVALEDNLRGLFSTLRNQSVSKGTKIRAVLDFHFVQIEQVKFLLEDLGVDDLD